MTSDRHDRFFRPPTTLVIDDEEGIRYALGRLLEMAGHKVLSAASGKEGLELLDAHPNEVALVICDFKMPGLDGIETLTAVAKKDPEVLRVLLTGYATLEAAIEATNQGLDAFVTKPYQVRELRAKLEEILGKKARALAARTLGSVPLFQDVPGDVLARVWPALTRMKAPRGTVLQEAGEAASRLLIVREGEVALEARMPDGRMRPIAWLGPDEHLGEGALLLSDKSPLRAVALLDSELLALDRADFERLRAQVPQLADAVARALGRRLHGVVQGPNRASLVLAVRRPAHHPHAAQQLAAAMASAGASVAYLDLDARRAGGEPGLVAGLRRHVIAGLPTYAAAEEGPSPGEEVSRAVAAVRQVHRVVVMALPADPAHAERARGQAHREVVFHELQQGWLRAVAEPLHDGPDEPVELSVPEAELAAAGPALRRLSRRLLGGSVGLALSAGGVRGMAHFGVLRAFERGGLELDALAGCSMGAVVGAVYATGMSIDKALVDFQVSGIDRLAKPALAVSKPAYETARGAVFAACEGVTFETARVPFLCNATDLEAGNIHVFESGPLAPAACASMATPPAFPPYYIDGKAYADGGLVNGLPADLLVERGLDLVAAVDVLHKPAQWKPPAESRGGFVANLISNMPAMVRYAAVLGVLERAFAITVRELVETRFTSCDLTIRPDIDVGPDDYRPDQYPALADAGERAAEDAVKALLSRRRDLLAKWG